MLAIAGGFGPQFLVITVLEMLYMQTTEMANSDLDKYYKALDGLVFLCLVRNTLTHT